MTALGEWRARFGIEAAIAASVLGISAELYARIETGEVEPEPELAMRIHIVTGGHVPISQWPAVRDQLIDGGLRLTAIAARHRPGAGGFGVNLYLGTELFARLDPGAADDLAAEIRAVAELARNPPSPIAAAAWADAEPVA